MSGRNSLGGDVVREGNDLQSAINISTAAQWQRPFVDTK